jgi:RNA recognition motif-containing protein
LQVFRSDRSEMEESNLRPLQKDAHFDGTVRLKNLPYQCTKQELLGFFNNCVMATHFITTVKDGQGRDTGYTYVSFPSEFIGELALEKHYEMLRGRYVFLMFLFFFNN